MPSYTPYPAPTPWINNKSANNYSQSQAIQSSGSPQGFVVNPYSGPQYASPADVYAAGNPQPYTPQMVMSQPKAQSGQTLGASVAPSNSGGGGGGNTISTDEALKRGWDINNLPSGYVRAQEGPSQSDIAAQQNKVRDTINQGFNGIFSQLDSLAGLAPQYQQQDEQFINDQYGIESQARQNELSANQAQLGT